MALRLAWRSVRGPLSPLCSRSRPALGWQPPLPPMETGPRPVRASPGRPSSGGPGLAALDEALLRSGGFVGGRWVQAEATFPVRDPATGAELSQVADCGVAEAQAAVRAAYDAGAAWSGVSAKVRAGAGGAHTRPVQPLQELFFAWRRETRRLLELKDRTGCLARRRRETVAFLKEKGPPLTSAEQVPKRRRDLVKERGASEYVQSAFPPASRTPKTALWGRLIYSVLRMHPAGFCRM